MEERKRNLLKRLESFFKEDEDIEEASLFSAEELEIPVDMLRVLVTGYGPQLIDILAEYSFLPLPGEADEVWYFSSVLTIETDIPREKAAALSNAIARLNFFMPYGGFCLSPEGDMLTYKSVTALRSDEQDDTLYKDIELSADTALLVPENFTDSLLRILDGRLSLSEFIEICEVEGRSVECRKLPGEGDNDLLAVFGPLFAAKVFFRDASAEEPVAIYQRDIDRAVGGCLRGVDDRARIR